MSQHDTSITLRQMRDYAGEAIEMARGRSRAELDSDLLLNRALVRTLELIGEAARRLPPDYRAEHPAVPWQRVIGLRNRLIHAYDEVDLDTIWEIVQHDLPPLAVELRRLVPES